MECKKKEKSGNARGSLSSRILLSLSLLLLIPLLVFVCLLYLNDVQVRKKEKITALKEHAERELLSIESFIAQKMELLEELFLRDPLTLSTASLQEWADRMGAAELLKLKEREKGTYLVGETSNEKLLGKELTYLIDAAKIGAFLTAGQDQQWLYLTLFSPLKNEAFVMMLSAQSLIPKSHPIEENSDGSLTLLDHDGKVLASTRQAVPKGPFPLSISREYHVGEALYFAEKVKLPNSTLSLLSLESAPKGLWHLPKFLWKVGSALLFFLLVGGVAATWLIKMIEAPLRHLIDTMQRVSKGLLGDRYSARRMGFEINEVGIIFNQTLDLLQKQMHLVQEERLKQEVYKKELMIGHEVQAALLPKELPTSREIECGVRYYPAKEVGGDFYDFLFTDELLISIADTAGKGISACLYSLSLRSILRSCAAHSSDLASIVKRANALFCEDTGDSGVFVTAFFAYLSPHSKRLRYTNCGHFPTLLCKEGGEIQSLSTPGMALGVLDFDVIEIEEVELEAGDTLLFFTDGLVEAHNQERELFGMSRLMETFRKAGTHSADEILNILMQEVESFVANAPQHDDLTAIVLKV